MQNYVRWTKRRACKIALYIFQKYIFSFFPFIFYSYYSSFYIIIFFIFLFSLLSILTFLFIILIHPKVPAFFFEIRFLNFFGKIPPFFCEKNSNIFFFGKVLIMNECRHPLFNSWMRQLNKVGKNNTLFLRQLSP